MIFTTGDLIGEGTQGLLDQAGRTLLPRPFTPGELEAIVKEALKQIEK